jgi:hypothetical protein
MSKLAEKVGSLLRELFPNVRIKEEHHVMYDGQRLFVDFFIPSYLIAVEVHGRQHDEFVRHFHGDDAGWRRHRKRDRRKEEWADVNDITYVVIRENNMPSDKQELLDLIRSCQRVR